jgi:hypothetical protein
MPQPSGDPDDRDRRRNSHPPFGVEVEAFESKLTTHSVGQSATASLTQSLFAFGATCSVMQRGLLSPTLRRQAQ